MEIIKREGKYVINQALNKKNINFEFKSKHVNGQN